MNIYLLSLGAGLLVGLVYSLLKVRSPAPPVVALIGLLGILAGEQILPLAKSIWAREQTGLSLSAEPEPVADSFAKSQG
ncbi:DUF1427 family protein [Neorhizobium lilium]|uniref:DUF1427 family protein n=1 Tax=Neorhizobium lilium TaxID=2503024 RepID=A0A3S3RQ83_9HYPH|nr:DUF1427 family protein [Neorhizobium lilium]RWX81766.1 DUF1427 family protein [Neorhizobium lilium]